MSSTRTALRRRPARARVRTAAAAALLALAASVLPATPTAASTLERGGTGARGRGTLGAAAALSAGPEAVYDNAAALGGIDAASALLSVGYRRYAVDLTQERGHTDLPAVSPPNRTLATAAVALPLTSTLGAGLLVHLPLTGPSRLLAYDARRPQLPLWQGLGERLAISAGVGWRALPSLRLGLTAHVAADLDATGAFALDLGRADVTHQELDIALNSRLVPGAALAWRPADRWRVLLRFRGAYRVGFDVPLTVAVDGVTEARIRVSGQGLLSPQVWTLASAWRAHRRLDLVASLRWERWSAMPSLAPAVRMAVADALAVSSSSLPVGAADVAVPQLGAQWRALPDVDLRGSVGFRPTPLPRADGQASWLDSHAVELAVGTTWRATGRLEVDFAVTWSHLVPRRVVRADASHPVGTTALSGDIFQVALTLRHRLAPRTP